jgi:hypothetical protein
VARAGNKEKSQWQHYDLQFKQLAVFHRLLLQWLGQLEARKGLPLSDQVAKAKRKRSNSSI